MQPTYFPWIGYFDLIDQSSDFIFLDDVQFSKQSFQQRNRLRTADGLAWLTVPVLSKGRSAQLIREVEINQGGDFPRKHVRAIEMHYARTPYFNNYFEWLKNILESGRNLLSELNIQLIKKISVLLGIEGHFLKSSELGESGKRSSLLVKLCDRVGADVYLSTIGAQEYLVEEFQEFSRSGIKVFLHQYEHPEYSQLYRPFIPFASIIDLLFNEGERSLEVIRSGRREPLLLQPGGEGCCKQ